MPANSPGPFVVAVTGGIGSGKSRVAGTFGLLGARVIDADAIARELVGEPDVLRALEARFGSGILAEDGNLDRSALAAKVFGNPEELQDLNEIVHPAVRARIDKDLAHLASIGSDEASPLPGKRPLVLLDIPLLETSPYRDRADVVLFVEAPLSDRVRRVTETRGWSAEELARREASQVPLNEKRSGADHLLPNPDGAEEDLEGHCRALIREWSAVLSASGGPESDEPSDPAPTE